jgi:hypothetical protein
MLLSGIHKNKICCLLQFFVREEKCYYGKLPFFWVKNLLFRFIIFQDDNILADTHEV